MNEGNGEWGVGIWTYLMTADGKCWCDEVIPHYTPLALVPDAGHIYSVLRPDLPNSQIQPWPRRV